VLTVVKVGGGVGDGALPGVCASLGELGRRHRLLVVPGGGRFADAVRDADRSLGLHPHTSHRMAILAMEQFGWLLSDLIRGVPVLLPAGLPLDELPASWDVTSDSIAAWVTHRVGAERLVLVKSAEVVDEYFATAIEGARFETRMVTPDRLAEVLDDPLLPWPHG
jgi:5-(aminomethyl)-3-furanmethanol phosphate kinase